MKKHLFYIVIALLLTLSAHLAFASSPNEIPAVLVKNNHHRSSHNTVGNTQAISHKKIVQSGATTIKQALQTLAGIQVEDLQGDGRNIVVSMRGFGTTASSNTLILVDGIPLTNPDMGAPRLDNIDINNVQRIEVSHGSAGVRYGNQAVGGVINIITRKPEKRQALISTRLGSYRDRELQITAENRFKNGLGLQVNASKHNTDNYREHNNLEEEHVSSRADYHYRNGTVYAKFQHAKSHALLAGALTQEQVAQDRRQAQNNTDFTNDQTNNIRVGTTRLVSDHWRIKADTNFRKTNRDAFNSMPVLANRQVFNLLPSATGIYSLKKGIALIMLGGDYENDRYRLEGFIPTSDRQTIQGLFGRAEIPIASKTKFTIGTRYSQLAGTLFNNKVETPLDNKALVSEIGLSKQITRALRFFLRRDGNFRFPKADENTLLAQGVEELKTQTGVTYETGMDWQSQRFMANATFYLLNLRNEIAFDPQQTPDTPNGANRNLDPTRRIGATFQLGYQINQKWQVSANYSAVDARFSSGTHKGKRIPFVAENIFHFTTLYQINPHWHLYGEAILTGSRFPAGDDANRAGALAAYLLINLNLRYQYKHWSLSARINNLLDKEYFSYATLSPISSNVLFYPAPTRNFLVTIDYAF